MSQGFYKERLLHSGINVLIPNEKEQTYINRFIHEELINGKVIFWTFFTTGRIAWKLENAVDEKLDSLHNDLETLLLRQHREMWQKETLNTAAETLKAQNEKGIFVVLLDAQGKVLD